MTDHGLRVRNIRKRFGSTVALDGVNLDIDRGTVHVLVGANGSGKSTLIKVLAGFLAPEPGGRVEIFSEQVPLPVRPRQLERLGVGVVHQTPMLAPGMSVLDNLMIGSSPHWGPQIRWGEARRRAAKVLADLRMDVALDQPVRELALHTAAMVAVARALLQSSTEDRETQALILDEPTAALTKEESEVVLETIERAAHSSGVALLLVDHRLDEIMRVADRITVLRDGRVAGQLERANASEESLVELIVGRRVDHYYPEAGPREQARAPLAMVTLTAPGRPPLELDLKVGRGEILGLTGMPESGYERVPYCLAGTAAGVQGELVIEGRKVGLSDRRLGRRMRMGLVVVPAGRGHAGLGLTVRENVSIVRGREFLRWGFWSKRRERDQVARTLRRYEVVPEDPEQVLGALSGGNQQKTILGRWMDIGPRLLVLHEPTEGVDVGARSSLFHALRRHVDASGGAAIVCSVEAADLAGICDRVLVFRDGRVAAELSGQGLTADHIVYQSLQRDVVRPVV